MKGIAASLRAPAGGCGRIMIGRCMNSDTFIFLLDLKVHGPMQRRLAARCNKR
jgi:hypothetical protein